MLPLISRHGSVNSFARKCWFGRELQQTPKLVLDTLGVTATPLSYGCHTRSATCESVSYTVCFAFVWYFRCIHPFNHGYIYLFYLWLRSEIPKVYTLYKSRRVASDGGLQHRLYTMANCSAGRLHHHDCPCRHTHFITSLWLEVY